MTTRELRQALDLLQPNDDISVVLSAACCEWSPDEQRAAVPYDLMSVSIERNIEGKLVLYLNSYDLRDGVIGYPQ